jgi:hypothetical protein
MTMSRQLARAAVLLTSASMFAAPAYAGYVVEQSVKVSLNGGSHVSRHLWNIDGDKFDLLVSTPTTGTDTNDRQFIFNGRIMYLCGKLDPNQLKLIGDLNVSDPAVLKKFQTGVCQEVPSNFLVRFFMSPVSAIESIDLSDGLKLTLEIEGFELKPTQPKRVAGQDTQGYSRNFSLQKSGDGGKTTQTIKESFFSGGGASVRNATWGELSKTLMRQPRGMQLLKHLRQDKDLVQGLMLESESLFESELPGGGKIIGTISAATTRFEASDMKTRKFRIPENYAVFSRENLQTIAAASARKPVESSAEAKNAKDDINLLDKVQSVFFCAISGALACFSR